MTCRQANNPAILPLPGEARVRSARPRRPTCGPDKRRRASMGTVQTQALAQMPIEHTSARALLRSFVIGLTAFLTVVDLFATQAILPKLTEAYGVTPAAMSFAVNA